MRRYAKALTAMVIVILRSLFLYGFSLLRKGSVLLSFTHIAITYIFGLNDIRFLVLYTLPILITYYIFEMRKLLLYTLTISSIPGLWMALTQLLLDLAKGYINPFRCIAIYARATLVTVNTMYILHTFNPTEVSILFNKVNKFAGVYPQLFFRVASFLVKEGIEIIYTHALKKESIWKTLAIIILRGEELAKGFSEGLIPKYRKYRPIVIYSLRTIAIQFAVIAYDIVITFVLTSIL
ncbi:MAG: hypothetical protein QW775_07420 [Ignisphaera sp.]|uniref:Energy-coupling factor transporter transmembrane protein EcfT n=1 Tax=Ignisphaera aggregans TaxID=334771 RepID=A0A7C4NLQ2_9CREN